MEQIYQQAISEKENQIFSLEQNLKQNHSPLSTKSQKHQSPSRDIQPHLQQEQELQDLYKDKEINQKLIQQLQLQLRDQNSKIQKFQDKKVKQREIELELEQQSSQYARDIQLLQRQVEQKEKENLDLRRHRINDICIIIEIYFKIMGRVFLILNINQLVIVKTSMIQKNQIKTYKMKSNNFSKTLQVKAIFKEIIEIFIIILQREDQRIKLVNFLLLNLFLSKFLFLSFLIYFSQISFQLLNTSLIIYLILIQFHSLTPNQEQLQEQNSLLQNNYNQNDQIFQDKSEIQFYLQEMKEVKHRIIINLVEVKSLIMDQKLDSLDNEQFDMQATDLTMDSINLQQQVSSKFNDKSQRNLNATQYQQLIQKSYEKELRDKLTPLFDELN